MNIIYHPNPLRSVVELDEHDRQILMLKLHIDALEDRLAGASIHLEEGKFFDIEQARKEVNEYGEAIREAERQFGFMVDSLQTEHIGDCTCVPCSCTKCHAESLLGINTIAGLGKHPAHYVSSVFDKLDDTEESLDQAIDKLENYAPVRAGGWLEHPPEAFEQCIPRWRSEAAHAAAWLREYRDQHFTRKDALDHGGSVG